ncbi:MAG: UvrB/UvrC motif-containing protein [Patescibacteria group bacterium]
MNRQNLQKYNLPDTPGVYMFLGALKRSRGGRDARHNILYVGKATSLRDRVRSYFGDGLGVARGARIVAMVECATNLTWRECGSVLEALILEVHLIKKHQPQYNVDERDDKSWNYVVITEENYPRILLVRGRELSQKWNSAHIKYTFGPFPHGGQLKEAMKIVRKIFPFRDKCLPAVPAHAGQAGLPNSGKPCFNRQIGLCPGVCSGETGAVEYAKTIRNFKELFLGNFKGLKQRLVREMKTAAKEEDFEHAEIFRRQISALEHIRDVSLIKSEKLDPLVSGQGKSRIEAFDVAHTSGSETVGVMTVVQDGELKKSAYRKFKIRTATNDDVASLKEILSRRLAHTEWQLPKLFVVDGGTAQLRVAQTILKNAGVIIPVIGVVKNMAHKPERLVGDKKMIKLHEREILLANSEAHRFAIQWHRMRIRKRNFA